MKNFSKNILLLLFALFISFSASFSQLDTTNFTIAKQIDTATFSLPLKFFGEFPSILQKSLPKTLFVQGDFISPFEVIEKNTHYKLLTFGALGYSSLLNEYGIVSSLNAFQNTISHYLLPGYYSSFEFFPILLIDKLQLLDGSIAHIFAKRSNGLALNFKTRIFNSSVPFTQIWIGQAGYEFLGSSGLFAQNIAKNLNFYFLYHRYWSAGRYSNSNADRWNLVAGIRWFPSSKLNFYLENKYTLLNYGLFGGLNSEKSLILFDKNFSAVNFENLKNRTSQNDLSLQFNYQLHQDTSTYLDGSILFSISKQNYNLDDYLAEPFHASKTNENQCNNLLAELKFVSNKPQYRLILGFEFEKRYQNEYLTFIKDHSIEPSFFAIFNKTLAKKFSFQIGSRIDFSTTKTLYRIGSRFGYNFSDSTDQVFLDVTYSRKSNDNLFDHSQLVILGFNQMNEKQKLSAEIYFRNISNLKTFDITKDSSGNLIGVSTKYINGTKILGVNLKSTFNIFDDFTFSTKVNLYYSAEEKIAESTLPFLIWTSELSYRLKRGKSYLDIGLEFELFSPFKGAYFHPLYPVPTKFHNTRQWQNNGINAFAHAKLGNAFVNISLRNILSVNYYLIPIYPEYDRSLRITVFWSFND